MSKCETDPGWVTTAEAAEVLGVSSQWVRHLVDSGQAFFPVIRRERIIFVRREVVIAWHDNRVRSGHEPPPLLDDWKDL